MTQNISVCTKTITIIDGVEYDVLYKFDVAHVGWDCDPTGYVINYQGENRLVLTNHGSPYLVSNQHLRLLEKAEGRRVKEDKEILEGYVSWYQELIKNTEKAIEMLDS